MQSLYHDKSEAVPGQYFLNASDLFASECRIALSDCKAIFACNMQITPDTIMSIYSIFAQIK